MSQNPSYNQRSAIDPKIYDRCGPSSFSKSTFCVAILLAAFSSSAAFCEDIVSQKSYGQLWVQQDYSGVLRLAEPRAKAGDPVAQGILGTLYQTGKGVGKDEAAARHWYELSAAQGHPDSQYHLGALLLKEALEQHNDTKQAIEWLLKAATQNQGAAEYTLGNVYKFGWGVPVDVEKAQYWHQKSFENMPGLDGLISTLKQNGQAVPSNKR